MNNDKFFFGMGNRKVVTLADGQCKSFSSFNDANSWSIQQKSEIVKSENFEAGGGFVRSYTKEDIVESTKLANSHGLNLPFPNNM